MHSEKYITQGYTLFAPRQVLGFAKNKDYRFESVELKLSGLNSIWRLAFNPTGIMHLEKYITQGSGLLAPGIYICKKERNLVCFLGKEMY
jgi:hypothetical protein